MRLQCLRRAALLWTLLLAVLSQLSLASAADNFDSLVAEIQAANSGASGEIRLRGDIVLTASLPAITGSLTIDGGGHNISGAREYRIFDVNGGRLALSNVTLTEGRAAQGGAILLRNGAEASIESSTLSANSATHGGAIATSSGSDRLTISESDFSGNIAEQSGGAIFANGGTVSIHKSAFEKNCALFAFYIYNTKVNSVKYSVDADGCFRMKDVGTGINAEVPSHVDGGAIRLENGARGSIEGSTFRENSATYGGAISTADRSVRLSVKNSSFIGNRASASGGAIGTPWFGGGRVAISSSSFVMNSAEEYDGGAINASHGYFDINNSTFSENYADNGGGAIKVDEDAEVTITHATFADNRTRRHGAKAISKTGGKAYLRNSIIASSRGGEDCVGVWDQNSGNLSLDGTCADRPSDDPRLGELTGSPAYYPLQDRSPAVDFADPVFCLETDQLGTPRPQGGGCDIGAIEATGAIAAEPTPVPPLVCSLAEQIVAANRDRPAGGCPAGSGVDTIALEKDITLFAALPAITSHIVIEGNGHSISGDRKFRIFDVDGGILTVNNLTMREGYSQTDNGGAIRLQNDGRATISDSRLIDNSANNGSAVFIGYVGTDRSLLTVNNSSFVGNKSSIEGAAIFAHGGTVSVRNSSFVNNSARSDGGAIKLAGSNTRLDVVNSSFINNYGGAIYIEYGVTATLTHVTFSGNGFAIDKRENAFTTAGNFNLRNSIVVGRLHSVCDNLKQNISNIILGGACSPEFSGDPMLEEATDSAAYLEPLPDSPAIGAADARFCPETDQLGRTRSIVGSCDIGAIESIPVRETLSDCTVTTTHTLNFREQPGGTRFGTVPESSTVTATARTPGWFQVEYRGASGWISADYVVEAGECG